MTSVSSFSLTVLFSPTAGDGFAGVAEAAVAVAEGAVEAAAYSEADSCASLPL